jgi:poly(A) polymerase/tRNA nucleotidyltransferase (CCA-adding enzyme)
MTICGKLATLSDIKPMKKDFSIPKEVLLVSEKLQSAGFEAYLVGGCVRDLLRGKKPRDYDITTNARPEEIVATFSHTFYDNSFGTVGVVNEETEDEVLKIIEVTTYRIEGKYDNARHPTELSFSTKLEDDLKRRDFTINAIALNPKNGEVVDLFDGEDDLKKGIIRAVGDAEERFSEDALRILRAVRLATELGFAIEQKTQEALQNKAEMLKKISKERIRDEFIRILLSDEPIKGLFVAQKLGILKYIAPDLERGIGVDQNQAHKFDVFEHNLRTMQHAADKKWDLDLRLASLFHDISKPETRRFSKEKNDWTFHGHEVVGAKLTKKILNDLKFPQKTIDKVVKLVRWHMFFSDPEQITLSAVRRLIANIGKEDIWELMNLRICDRIGTGRPKENPYRFRKYKSMVEEAMEAPLSVGMLKIKGDRIMEILGITPSPKIGFILHALFDEVLDDPTKNNVSYLEKRAGELNLLSIDELKALGEEGKERKEIEQEKKVKEIRSKYHVE